MKLPFEYKMIQNTQPVEEVLQLFDIECKEYVKSEVKPQVDSDVFFKCKTFEGFTLVEGEKFKLMALNIDGEADGIYEEFLNACVIFQNHPSLTLLVESARIFNITVEAAAENPFKATELQKFINSIHLKEEAIDAMNAKFAEASTLTIEAFSTINPIDGECFRVGPADYRSFQVEREANDICQLFTNSDFIKYFAEVTGLPLGLPITPPFARVLSSSGDYQILHGNYSEPFGLDVVFTFYPGKQDCFEWSEEVCGHIHYLDQEGSEIFQVPNSSNSLTLVYRTEGVVRFLENIKGENNPKLIQVLATFSILE